MTSPHLPTAAPGTSPKTYTGYRIHSPDGGTVTAAVTVHQEGCEPRPLDPRFDLLCHSPTGLEWGFLGSGPAQLSLALAADLLGDDDRAREVYQELKFKLVGRLPEDGWTIPEEQLRQTLLDLEQERQERRGR